MQGLVVGGKYHVVQPIGHGGMGTVYDAIHAKTGRRVALKLIHERLVTTNGGRRRFEREARAAATIDSLHVVQILDSGEDETSGMPFIVMEHLQGDDLRSLLKRGPLPARVAIAIAVQICLGLKKAHENDVVHRDLKPGNVFLTKMDDSRRVVKLLDFGIAKLVAEGEGATTDVTATNDVVGSPPYMSPEQLRSPNEVDELTDIWALGVVLYEMLSGQTPTAGIETIGARAYAICHTPAQPLRTLVPDVSRELAAIVHRAIKIERSNRFASIADMLTELRSVATQGADILEEDIVLLLGSDRPRTSLEAATSTRPVPRIRWRLAMGGVGLLALVGIVWATASRGSRMDTSEVQPSPPAVATIAASSSPPPSASPAPSATAVTSAAASAQNGPLPTNDRVGPRTKRSPVGPRRPSEEAQGGRDEL